MWPKGKQKNGLNGGCQELGRKGSGELFNGNTVSVSQDEEDLWHNNVDTLNTTGLCAHKWLRR